MKFSRSQFGRAALIFSLAATLAGCGKKDSSGVRGSGTPTGGPDTNTGYLPADSSTPNPDTKK